MGWWLFRRHGSGEGRDPDYYREGLNLAQSRKYHEALTSFRLALRQSPHDPEIMQQMAVVYTEIGMPDEAIRLYEDAIEADRNVPAAHYGLAFLFLRRGDVDGALRHLRAFLDRPPTDPEAEAHVAYATRMLERLERGETPTDPDTLPPVGGAGGS